MVSTTSSLLFSIGIFFFFLQNLTIHRDGTSHNTERVVVKSNVSSSHFYLFNLQKPKFTYNIIMNFNIFDIRFIKEKIYTLSYRIRTNKKKKKHNK